MTKTENTAVPEMVELVGRVLEPQAWTALGLGDTLTYKNRRTSSLRKARAAIEAMMEPTDDMVEAFYGNVVMTSEGSAVGFALGWRAALRASLQTKGEKP